QLLVHKDPRDARDVILEVKAGEGGEESALFAGDLLRMYLRYAERHGWKTEILDSTVTGLGGTKDATVAIKAAGRGVAPVKGAAGAGGGGVRVEDEGGVHRGERGPGPQAHGRGPTPGRRAPRVR